jgi:hypothetical protein
MLDSLFYLYFIQARMQRWRMAPIDLQSVNQYARLLQLAHQYGRNMRK